MGRLVQVWFNNDQYDEAYQFIKFYNNKMNFSAPLPELKLSTGMRLQFLAWIKEQKKLNRKEFNDYLEKNDEKEIVGDLK